MSRRRAGTRRRVAAGGLLAALLLAELAALLGLLASRLALGRTLPVALDELARGPGRPGPVWAAFCRLVDLHLPAGADAVLHALARELGLAELDLLALRLEAAREGAYASELVVRQIVADLESALWASRQEELEAAPTRLILPLLAGLFPPVLVLVVWPLALTVVEALGAVPSP